MYLCTHALRFSFYTMETLFTPRALLPSSSVELAIKHPILSVKSTRQNNFLRTAAISEVFAAADPAPVVATWQIVVGSLAGVTPFVVAGIEFSKRIVAQRKCDVCKGSGLVLRDNKYYFRCPNCGGFLPWQSWKRFFSG